MSITAYFCHMIKRIANWLRTRRLYVIADASDSSITVSRKLYGAMDIENTDDIRIFVFRVKDGFGFSVNWEEANGEDVQFSTLQFNVKYKTIGFETLNPTVARMFYDFNLPSDIAKCKLAVSKEVINGRIYFKIHKPCAI